MPHQTYQPAGRTEQRDVTLLFADLRGFTELASARDMQPVVYELLGHVMDCLTEAIHRQHGTVVDYYGDGLVAMWNAPVDQPRHADLTCTAAIEMLKNLPAVSAEWNAVLQTELRLGVGIHTGTAHVGNAGSTQQPKYGPRGANVNLASRVEAATKELGLPLLATWTTAERLSPALHANRVCRARLPGLREAVDLFAVRRAADATTTRSSDWQCYAIALEHFEQNRFHEAEAIVSSQDQNSSEVPWKFLNDAIRREIGRQQSRRSTDKPASETGGVVVLSSK